VQNLGGTGRFHEQRLGVRFYRGRGFMGLGCCGSKMHAIVLDVGWTISDKV